MTSILPNQIYPKSLAGNAVPRCHYLDVHILEVQGVVDLHCFAHLPSVGLAGEVVDPQLVPLDGLGQGLVAGFHPLVRSPGKLDLVKLNV